VRALPAPAVGATQLQVAAYPFSSSAPLSGRADLDKLISADAFLVLRYAPGTLTTGPTLIGAGVAPPIEQTGADTVNAMVTKVALDQTLDVKVHPLALAQRYAAVRPATGAAFAMGWSVVAAPGALSASTAGPTLASGTVAMADVDLKGAKFGNPFASTLAWRSLVAVASGTSRTVTLPGMTLPVTLNTGINHYFEPAAGIDLADTPGLPVLITLAGQQLSTDGATVARPAAYVAVSFLDDQPAGTLYSVELHELVATMGAMTLGRRVVFVATGSEPTFMIRPDVFEVGHTYTLRAVTTLGGYPQVATGELTARALPIASAYADSGAFTVTP
jgi:hypothetical protein